MEDMVTTGVNESAVAEQTNVTQETVETTSQENTGVEAQAAAVPNEGVEKAFAARLAKERERIEAEYKNRFQTELKSNPHLSYLEQKAQRLGMSVEQLIESDRKYEEQEKLNQLIQQNIPEEYAKKLLKVDELEKWKTETEREKSERELKETTEKARRESTQKQVDEFDQWFSKKNGRMADFTKDIPKEVIAVNMKGVPLLYAYKAYLLEQTEGKQQIEQANQANAENSTGSAKSSGKTGAFFTREQVSAMSRDEIKQNYTAIKESEKHWK